MKRNKMVWESEFLTASWWSKLLFFSFIPPWWWWWLVVLLCWSVCKISTFLANLDVPSTRFHSSTVSLSIVRLFVKCNNLHMFIGPGMVYAYIFYVYLWFTNNYRHQTSTAPPPPTLSCKIFLPWCSPFFPSFFLCVYIFWDHFFSQEKNGELNDRQVKKGTATTTTIHHPTIHWFRFGLVNHLSTNQYLLQPYYQSNSTLGQNKESQSNRVCLFLDSKHSSGTSNQYQD